MKLGLFAFSALFVVAGRAQAAVPADPLEAGFRDPPASARPLTFWHWMNGCVTKEGITKDLESFKRVGLAGSEQFLVGGTEAVLDDPSVAVLNDKWRELFKFAVSESARLNLEFGTHNSPGWSSSGFPTVPVEDSMQKLVFGEAVTVTGPVRFERKLAAGAAVRNYYQDVAVLAYKGQMPAAGDVVDVSSKLGADGTLTWDAPAGDWTVVRIGHTTTGKTNPTAPPTGQGLEVDKFSRAALERFWKTFPETLIKDAGAQAGKTFKRFEIDSYEAGPQDWTPLMRDEFKKRRGYDPLPWLLTLNSNRTVESAALTARFKADWSLTIGELFADNYYGYMRELVHRVPGMELMMEPYNTNGVPLFDANNLAGRGDMVTCEFWEKPATWGWDCVNTTASGVHTWGSPGGIVAAEAFTGLPQMAWQVDPLMLKTTGDRAFADGVNRMVFHTSAQQPWDVAPGMTMGWWGTQFGRTQTWWEHGAKEWIAYLSRCQFLLQQGLYVADLVYLEYGRVTPAAPVGYSADCIGTDALLSRMSVKDGRLILPDGMSYKALVLPNRTTMSPQITRKIKQLVEGGAWVFGPKPLTSPSLENYPGCDQEVAAIGDELWGADGTPHDFGQGRVFTTGGNDQAPAIVEALKNLGPDVKLPAEFAGPATFTLTSPAPIMWNHRRTADADIYFVSNQTDNPVFVDAMFRIVGKTPELWHPDTGLIERSPFSGMPRHTDSHVPLTLGPSGSVFVVFRKNDGGFPLPTQILHDGKLDFADGLTTDGAKRVLTAFQNGEYQLKGDADIKFRPIHIENLSAPLTPDGPWQVAFQAGRGAPASATFDKLISWSDHSDKGIKYFSGTATYSKDVDVPGDLLGAGKVLSLDLGAVRNIAEVRVNEVDMPLLWKPPFRVDVTAQLHAGRNKLQIRITNLWPNRLIGDEQFPSDQTWAPTKTFTFNNRRIDVGQPLALIPEWLKPGADPLAERPVKERLTFSTFNFFTKDSPLLPSGLLGPVQIVPGRQVEVIP